VIALPPTVSKKASAKYPPQYDNFSNLSVIGAVFNAGVFTSRTYPEIPSLDHIFANALLPGSSPNLHVELTQLSGPVKQALRPV
jgi:hypothetical protein